MDDPWSNYAANMLNIAFRATPNSVGTINPSCSEGNNSKPMAKVRTTKGTALTLEDGAGGGWDSNSGAVLLAMCQDGTEDARKLGFVHMMLSDGVDDGDGNRCVDDA